MKHKNTGSKQHTTRNESMHCESRDTKGREKRWIPEQLCINEVPLSGERRYTTSSLQNTDSMQVVPYDFNTNIKLEQLTFS